MKMRNARLTRAGSESLIADGRLDNYPTLHFLNFLLQLGFNILKGRPHGIVESLCVDLDRLGSFHM